MKIARHLSLLCGLFLIPLAAFGSSKTWTGAGGNALWSNGANWAGGGAPKNGDDLVFGGQTRANDLHGLSPSSLTGNAGSPAFRGDAASVGALPVTSAAILSSH